MPFTIIRTNSFHDFFTALQSDKKERVQRIIYQIMENGDLVGRPLRFSFFREKRLNGDRLYFLLYAEWNVALLVMFSDKKEQSTVIDAIIQQLPRYKEFVYAKLKEEGII